MQQQYTQPVVEIIAVGQAACTMGVSVAVVHRTAKRLGVRPAYRINAIDYYMTADVQRICERVSMKIDRQSKR